MCTLFFCWIRFSIRIVLIICAKFAQSTTRSHMETNTAKTFSFIDFEKFDITITTDLSDVKVNFKSAIAEKGFGGAVSKITYKQSNDLNE